LYLALHLARIMIILENHKHIICVPQTFNGTKELLDVILGIDTRAIEGEIVHDKNCGKIHYLPPNTYYK
jgi:hypothetical protein